MSEKQYTSVGLNNRLIGWVKPSANGEWLGQCFCGEDKPSNNWIAIRGITIDDAIFEIKLKAAQMWVHYNHAMKGV